MANLAVNVAILQQGKILLTQREDFHVWCLPGGAVENNESLTAAAMREAKEETGFEVRPLQLVGIYRRPNFGGYGECAVFVAEIVGGTLKADPAEVLQASWFAQEQIPGKLLFGQAERIRDVFAGAAGLIYTNAAARPANWPANREALYAARDSSGMSRAGFYLDLISQISPKLSARHVAAAVSTAGKRETAADGSWLCPACNERVDANLDVCWQCGTARDGTPDPQFEPDNRTFLAKPNTCIHCGYSLLGLTVNRCPECGEYFSMTEMKYLRLPEDPLAEQ